MGLLSWMGTATRDGISRIIFILLIAGIIGFIHLPHSIFGAMEVLLAFIGSQTVSLNQLLHFLLWATLGNLAGCLLFAILICFGNLLHKRISP